VSSESFAESVALITGGAGGIGLELARALANAGADLVLADIDSSGLGAARSELESTGATIHTFVVDVADEKAVERLAEDVFRDAGQVDCLINCAGVYPVTNLLDLTCEEWDRVIATNLRGPFLMTRTIARRMIDARIAGRILNISSTASTLARPGVAHYGATKAGLNQLTRVAAVELAPHGIRVNAVLPGVIETERVRRSLESPEARAESEAKRARIPLRRFGQPGELVALSLFLLSDASSYCTGGLYTVDGGFSLGMTMRDE
jgi:NAD(P)-dependent dehydrogenase (short-subunit alcohol dehydrogenase family)